MCGLKHSAAALLQAADLLYYSAQLQHTAHLEQCSMPLLQCCNCSFVCQGGSTPCYCRCLLPSWSIGLLQPGPCRGTTAGAPAAAGYCIHCSTARRNAVELNVRQIHAAEADLSHTFNSMHGHSTAPPVTCVRALDLFLVKFTGLSPLLVDCPVRKMPSAPPPA